MASPDSPPHSPDGKLKISGSEPISTFTVEGKDPVFGCLVNIPKDAKSLRENLEIDSPIQQYAYVCCTPAFREATGDIHVVVCRGYTDHGNKKFTIKANHKKTFAPQSSQDTNWVLIACQDHLKHSRMRKLLKGLHISTEEEPSQICKGNLELCGIGEKDGKLVFQPFKILVTDDDSFCLGRDSFKHLKPSGPLLDKEKKNVLGFYWSRENKLVLSWLQKGQVVVEIADEIIVTDAPKTSSSPSSNGAAISDRKTEPEVNKKAAISDRKSEPGSNKQAVTSKPKLTVQDIELNIYRNNKDSGLAADKRVGPGDPVSSLWEKDASFRDQLATSLDRVYKVKGSVKYWPQLASETKVAKEEYEKFSNYESFSPSERMFRYIEAAKPRLAIEQLQTALKRSNQEELLRVLNEYNNAGHLKKINFLAEMVTYTPGVLGQIMVRMDRDGSWRDIATNLDIPKRVFEQFNDEMKDNPTRQLLHLVHTHNTKLTVEDVKEKLKAIDRDDVIENMDEVPAKIGIDALLNHFTVTEEIERKLNREDSFLKNWRHLAELYKDEGLLTDDDIKSLQPERVAHSPTTELISHVLQTQKPEPTVEDLVVYFARMRRVDCMDVVARYLKRGWRDVEDILYTHPQLGYRKPK